MIKQVLVMNRVYVLFFMMMLCSGIAVAQNTASNVVAQSAVCDTVTVQREAAVDSTLVGMTVFEVINKSEGEAAINQSASVDYAFKKYVEQNGQKKLNGYRIRIFFDNKQTARVQSEEIEKTFVEAFPQYPVYRTYTNPYFKVAVGDFRTKSDAVKVLQVIQRQFPKAFIIKDVINYPL